MKEEQNSKDSILDVSCHICNKPALKVIPGYERLCCVTSDCQPWPRGGRLCVCQACGCIQKVTDQAWQTETEQIYEAYTIYHQGEGAEQAVFEQDSGRASPRSARLLECLQTHTQLPETGRLLDIGCGNGGLLRTFSRLAPYWSLVGTELNDKYRAVVESIDRVEKLYTCNPDQVPGAFNLITMVHVLEHILDPKEFLVRLRHKLENNGLLVVEVPDHLQNPFDLLIADHCTHFTTSTITWLIQSAGYEVISAATDWVPKELTVIAHQTSQYEAEPGQQQPVRLESGFESTSRGLQWLEAMVTAARKLSQQNHFGLFGTSIAATWLFGELEDSLKDSVKFFVDEDPQRAGKTYMGRPIYHPQQVPRGSHVFLALSPGLAETISRRVARPGVKYHLLPLASTED